MKSETLYIKSTSFVCAKYIPVIKTFLLIIHTFEFKMLNKTSTIKFKLKRIILCSTLDLEVHFPSVHLVPKQQHQHHNDRRLRACAAMSTREKFTLPWHRRQKPSRIETITTHYVSCKAARGYIQPPITMNTYY